jgi:hypothetical protein
MKSAGTELEFIYQTKLAEVDASTNYLCLEIGSFMAAV